MFRLIRVYAFLFGLEFSSLLTVYTHQSSSYLVAFSEFLSEPFIQSTRVDFATSNNKHVEYFEEISIGISPLKSVMWIRYVINNIFILSEPHQENVQLLLVYVNSIWPYTVHNEKGSKRSTDLECTRFKVSVYQSKFH